MEDANTLASRITQEVSKITFTKQRSQPADPKESVASLIRTVSQAASKIARDNPDWDQKQITDAVLNAENVAKQQNDLNYDNARLHKAYQLAKDERTQIGLIETGQGIRRTIWRAASTASVTGTVLLLWNLAIPFDFAVPLGKLSGIPG